MRPNWPSRPTTGDDPVRGLPDVGGRHQLPAADIGPKRRYTGWGPSVRPRLAEAGLDAGWLAELIPPGGYLADFLTPPPGNPPPPSPPNWPRSAPPRPQVHADLDHLARTTPRRQALRGTRKAALEKITDEIEAYWELALAPTGRGSAQLLEADVFHRARRRPSTAPLTCSTICIPR